MRGTAYVKRARPALLVVAAVTALLLAGCTPATADQASPGSTTTTAPRPTGKSTPMPVRFPAPACQALATPGEVSALVGGTATPSAIEHLQPGVGASDAPWDILNANGAVCGWGGLSTLIENQGQSQVYLEMVPGLADTWAALAAANKPSPGAYYDGGTSLGGQCDAQSLGCFTNVLVNGSWLTVQARGYGAHALTERGFHDFVQKVVTRYRALPAPSVVHPHSIRACDAPELANAVATAFGTKASFAQRSSEFNLQFALKSSGRTTECYYVNANDEHVWQTTVSVLDDVAPALFEHYRGAVDHPNGRPADVSALPGTAVGVIEETADSVRVTIDVLVDGRWVEVTTYQQSDAADSVALVKKIVGSAWLG